MPPYRYARRAEILGASLYDHAHGTIPLSSGMAYPPFLPDVVHEATEAARRYPEETLQYGPLMGIPDLREAICRFVAADGVTCAAENVLVTYGAKDALDLACRVFVEPGDRVIVTRPTYMTALQIMRTHGASFLGIDQDEEGLDTEALEAHLRRLEANGERQPKLLFDVPDFHNPTGITMSAARRRRLIELAETYGFIILEDDPYRRIRFEGDAVAPIKSFDRNGVVVALGTVSKILAPGLRVGWAIGDAEIIQRMAMHKADGGTNPFAQRIVAEMMGDGKVTTHIDALAAEMRRHRDVMTAALAEHCPAATTRIPQGGYFLWAALPEGSDAERLADLALAHGVQVSPGRLSFPEETPGHHIRLSYSFVGPAEIQNGVIALGKAWDEYRAQSPRPARVTST